MMEVEGVTAWTEATVGEATTVTTSMAAATEDLRMVKGIAVVVTTNTSIPGTEGPTTAGADSKTKVSY